MFGIMVTLVFVLSSAVATAQTVSDSQTGLAVTPPPYYAARSAPSHRGSTALIEVKRKDDRDTGCNVAFHPGAHDSSLHEARTNDLVGTAERRAEIESRFGSLYEVGTVEEIEHAGVRGAVATATLKPLPELPSRASELISVFYFLETPSGRTTIVCVSEKQALTQRRTEFDAVLGGVTLPR